MRPPPSAGTGESPTGGATGPDTGAAERLLARLRDFAADLDPSERALLGALLAPGVALAHEEPEEVSGFGLADEVSWRPAALPDALRQAVRGRDVRITGLDV